MLVAAGEPLLRRAIDEGSVRPDITMADLMILANGISLAAQPMGAPKAEQLLTLALKGIGISKPARSSSARAREAQRRSIMELWWGTTAVNSHQPGTTTP